MVDALVLDGLAAIKVLEGRTLPAEVTQAGELLATVIGQDAEQTPDGTFRIAKRVAPDRVISTVDPEARHGRKSSAHGFDGFKGHVSIDPDSEIVVEAEAGPANQGDGEMMPTLLAEFAPVPDQAAEPEADQASEAETDTAGEPAVEPMPAVAGDPARPAVPEIYGDCAYGSGAGLALLEQLGATPMVKVQTPHGRNGCFAKDRFDIDLGAWTVTCPNNVTVILRPLKDGGGYASFGKHCAACPLRDRCTTAKDGRVVNISEHEALLAEARLTQSDPDWKARYRATRPKVERKQAHMMRRRHGGRRARVRGQARIDQDFKVLAAVVNFARMAVLGVASTPAGWAAATT
jgi:hypothetical protein